MIEEDNPVRSPRRAVTFALLSSGIYILVTWILYSMEVAVPDTLNFLMVLAAFAAGITATQIALMRSGQTSTGFELYWRYGNISGFLTALVITIYHGVVLAQTAGTSGIFYFLGFSLMSKCLLGLVISAIVAFFISKI